jgi:hypothetical protein
MFAAAYMGEGHPSKTNDLIDRLKPPYPTKLGETTTQGNIYNPFNLWSLFPPSSILLPTPGTRRKTLLKPRNLVRKVGLQRVWVP